MLCFLPFSIDRRIHRTWRFGVVLCGLGTLVHIKPGQQRTVCGQSGCGYGHAMKDNSIKVMNMFVSIYLLTMLSVDRYISIVRGSLKTSHQKWIVHRNQNERSIWRNAFEFKSFEPFILTLLTVHIDP